MFFTLEAYRRTMNDNMAWFTGGVIIMGVLGFWLVLWYKSATNPVIVPYAAPSPVVPLRSTANVDDSLTPSVSPVQNMIANPHVPGNPLFDQPSEDTPEPSITSPLSGSPSPSVFPPQQ